MRRAVAKVVKAYRQQHPERTYTVISPEEVWVVEGSLQCIEQILDNLLSNAAKYSPKEAPITVRIRREGSQLAVSVEDQGIGVDPAEVEELFSPFYRSSKTTEVSGVGLGLSVCLRLVQAQAGRIWAQPNDGKGSVFAFSLPIATDGAEDLEVDLEPEAPAAAVAPA